MNFSADVHLTGLDPVADAKTALPAVNDHEVIHMTFGAVDPDLRAYFDNFVEALGTPVDIAEDFATGGAPTGERWSEICYRSDVPDGVAFRHSKNAQPLHTDESYVSSPAGIMLFYCENPAPTGGETIFVSGKRLIDLLRSQHRELLEQLQSIKVRYAKAGDFKFRPIVLEDDDGSVDLNYNYYCADPEQSPEALELNQRFFDFLQNDLPEDLVMPVGLQRGEAVAWRDSLVLHGRHSFTAVETGDRLIWKTGVVLGV